MKKGIWKPCVFFILLTETVGILAALLTRSGIQNYRTTVQKPALTPPGILFPIVWTVLYALMGIGAARIWLSPPSRERKRSLDLFLLQLAVNFFWSIYFFRFQAFGFSFFWLIFLWILIFLMILSFRKIDQTAARLQIPYLLWVTFAGYLNYMVWMLNR